MFKQSLSPKTATSLALLGKTSLLDDAYLAGGTACALWLGHRISYDLDFFTKKDFKVETVASQLVKLPKFRLKETAWGTILGNFANIDFSLFYYRYSLIKPTTKFQGINIASLEDIAAMKIAAISDRGTKRDFIDIYYILQKLSLEKILQLYNKKYKNLASNQVHILKSLTYFDDAESNKVPQMLKQASWSKVKKFLITEVNQLEKSILT